MISSCVPLRTITRPLLLLILLAGAALPLTALADDDDGARRPHRGSYHCAQGKTQALKGEVPAAAKADLYGNRLLYDVTYYDLAITPDPVERELTGTVTMRVTVVDESIDVMVVDCESWIDFTSVAVNGVAATWTEFVLNGARVNLDRTYVPGEQIELVIDYFSSIGLFQYDVDEQPVLYTWGQRYGAARWWPCKDHESDKADSLDVHITVSAEMTAVSQGNLVGVDDHGATKTYHWKHRHPITTYGVSVNIHPYAVFSDWYTPQDGGDPMEIYNYVYPAYVDTVQETFGKASTMMDLFAQRFGEYPYLDEKYGHAMDERSGGMEHPTISGMGYWGEDLVTHELAHAWFGNHVTCTDFHHAWLHEGFATWAEAYWREQTAGFDVYQLYMQSTAYYGPGTVYADNVETFYDAFDIDLRYHKAAWVVHMLRGLLGDDDFFAGLRQFITDFGGGSASTEDLQAVMESVSGLDLETFFQQWIYAEGNPIYDFRWSQDGGVLNLTIDQIQTLGGPFAMPMQVQVVTDAGVELHEISNSLASEAYALPVSGTVESVLLDPDGWILKQTTIPRDNPLFSDGLLLVNGGLLDHERYIPEMAEAFDDSVYTGTIGFDFWDAFPETEVGYPASLPRPLGHGPIPAEVIGRYSAIVWFGNNYNGDLPAWESTPIIEYLQLGGNVLLMGRLGSDFFNEEMNSYAGLTWTDLRVEIGDCTSVHPDLVDVPLLPEQTYIDLFDPTVGPNTTLLTMDQTGQANPRGLGFHAAPPVTPEIRTEGGQFVYLGGRPYRMESAPLRANVDWILRNLMGQPNYPSDVPDGDEIIAAKAKLLPAYPNPFNPTTVIPYRLPAAGRVELSVYDVAGRLVRTLVAEEMPAGRNEARWDGADQSGRSVASGTYFARMRSGEVIEVQPLTLIK